MLQGHGSQGIMVSSSQSPEKKRPQTNAENSSLFHYHHPWQGSMWTKVAMGEAWVTQHSVTFGSF